MPRAARAAPHAPHNGRDARRTARAAPRAGEELSVHPKATANARQRFAEMSAVTGPQVSSVSLVLSLIGTITGNRALTGPARAQRAHSFMIIFEASKNLARFRRDAGPVLVVAYD